jgi:periplasmic protein CpxP/Spy
MRNIKVMLTVLAMVLLATCSVYAQNPQPVRKGGEKAREDVFKQLNLTKEQEKQLTDNRQAESQKMAQLRTAMKENQQRLQQALKDPAVTREKVGPLVNEIKALQAQLIDGRVDSIFAVKQILTPEQYAKFHQIMEEKQKEQRQGSKEKLKGLGQPQQGAKAVK